MGRARLWVTGTAVGAALCGCALEASGLGTTAGTLGEPSEDAGVRADAGAGEVTRDASIPDVRAVDPLPTVDAAVDALGAIAEPTDAAGVIADAAPPPPPLVGRWNIDGPTYVGTDFPGTWTAAPVPGICSPNNYEATSALHGTNDAPLFEGEVYGNPATCTVGSGLAAGTYRVTLLFAEIYWGDGCPGGGGVGSRVFDVVIEGVTLLDDFDILAASGGCLASTTSDAGAPVAKTFEVVVSDGTIDISLPASVDNGKLSALEVRGPL